MTNGLERGHENPTERIIFPHKDCAIAFWGLAVFQAVKGASFPLTPALSLGERELPEEAMAEPTISLAFFSAGLRYYKSQKVLVFAANN